MPARNPLKSFVMMMFSMMLSRRVSTRVLVQAFTTRSNGVATRSVFAANNFHIHRPFSSARGVAAEVDEDLDSALDSLLGDAIRDVETAAESKDSLLETEPKGAEVEEHHMKDSHPVPPKLVETVSC
jgi:hypothetical protein